MGNRASRRRRIHGDTKHISGSSAKRGSAATEALVTNLQDLKRYYTKSKGMHNDVDVLLAATSPYPFALPQSWRDCKYAGETHWLLLRVWEEAFTLRGIRKPCTFMGRRMFEELVKRYLISARVSSDALIDEVLQYSVEAVQKIVEHSIRFDKTTAPQDLFTERVHHDLQDSLEACKRWIAKDTGNLDKIKSLVRETCVQGFEDKIDLLVTACLQYFSRRTEEVLRAVGNDKGNTERVIVLPPPSTKYAGNVEWLLIKSYERKQSAYGRYGTAVTVTRCPFLTKTEINMRTKDHPESHIDSNLNELHRIYVGDCANDSGSNEGSSEAKQEGHVSIAVEDHALEREATAAAVVTDALILAEGPQGSNPLHNFSYFMDLVELHKRTVTLSNLLHVVGINRIHLESELRSSGNKLVVNVAGEERTLNISTSRSVNAGNNGLDVVHIDEFVRWFLPAVNEIFTVQTFLNENATAFPDVCAALEGFGISSPAPFPR